MAKKVVSRLKKTDVETLTKVIKMVKSPKTDSYEFREEMVPSDKVKDFLKN